MSWNININTTVVYLIAFSAKLINKIRTICIKAHIHIVISKIKSNISCLRIYTAYKDKLFIPYLYILERTIL